MYYKLYKNLKETKEYLKAQPYYPSLVTNLKKALPKGCEGAYIPNDALGLYVLCPCNYRDVLDGRLRKNTFKAFDWNDTEEGYKFWEDAEVDFLEWFWV